DLLLHSTGGDWFGGPTPNPAGQAKGALNELTAVRCTSAASCWAVGDSKRPGAARRDQILHWTGMKWTSVSAPAPGGTGKGHFSQLRDVSCVSARNCWAVGRYGFEKATSTGDSEVDLTQVLHWTGKKWSLVSSPNPGGTTQAHFNELNSVR